MGLGIIQQPPELRRQVEGIARPEPGAAGNWDRLAEPAVVARHDGLATRLGFDGGHAEHLVLAGRHDEDVGQVVNGREPLLGDGPEVEPAGLANSVRPRVAALLAAPELTDGSRDDQPQVVVIETQGLKRIKEQVGPLLSADPPEIEEDAPLDPEVRPLGPPEVVVGAKLVEVDTVVDDGHPVGGQSPVDTGLVQAILRDGKEPVERHEKASVDRIKGATPAPVEQVVVVGQEFRRFNPAGDQRPLRLVVEVEDIDALAAQVRNGPRLELDPGRPGAPSAGQGANLDPLMLDAALRLADRVDNDVVARRRLPPGDLDDPPLDGPAKPVQHGDAPDPDMNDPQSPPSPSV